MRRKKRAVTTEQLEYAASLALSPEQLESARKREAVARAARVTIGRVEGRNLREMLTERASRLGHSLHVWKESVSCDGKWVSSCRKCGGLAIMYETTPPVGEDITGKALTHECSKGD